MILSRRRLGLLAPAAALIPRALAAPAPAPAPRQTLAFDVWRQGSRIGTHTVDFDGSADTYTVRSHAHFSVGLGPITVFHYLYQVAETWHGGTLLGFNATTDNNGRPDHCSAHRQGDALAVSGSKSGDYTAPPGSIAGTHWNKAELGGPIINPENGVLMHFTVAEKGQDAPPGGGQPATHYALTGFATLDLWYDDKATWVGLRAVAKDKSVIEYHRSGPVPG